MKGGLVAVTPQMSAMLKPDASFVKRRLREVETLFDVQDEDEVIESVEVDDSGLDDIFEDCEDVDFDPPYY